MSKTFVEELGWLSEREAAWYDSDLPLTDFAQDGVLLEREPTHDWDRRTRGHMTATTWAAPNWGAVRPGWALEGRRRPIYATGDDNFLDIAINVIEGR